MATIIASVQSVLACIVAIGSLGTKRATTRLHPAVDLLGSDAYYASMANPPLLGTFEQLVLAAIVQVGDGAYPPPVLARIERSTGRAVNRGSFYVSLDRLERKNLLRSRPDEGASGRAGRPRRHLEVTEEGLAALRHARNSLLASWDGIETLLRDET
ncbi:MAG: PadR family transcriptional regulator [Armatimonadota bacterium]|nr:MAG: PadR family transcriptional regulator [Armatimonadota bacterium]